MESGLKKDIEKKYIDAVIAYENEISNNSNQILVDNYINLAFLYWSFAFELFEFNIPNNINEDYSIIGGNRYKIILDQGLNNYPKNLELNFWKKYFQHIIYGDKFTENDCERLLIDFSESQSIVPYFFLYLHNKDKYTEIKKVLLDKCNNCLTAKNIYIISIISNR